MSQPRSAGTAPTEDLESTATLLVRVRGGDPEARNHLASRYLITLQRWAHGRLPAHARDLVETQDLVQVSLLKALDHVERFEPRHEGSFLAYLRKVLLNQIRMEIRRVSRRPGSEPLDESAPSGGCTPLDHTIGTEVFEDYERALDRLSPEEREGVILRLELGFTHRQVAEALGKPSPDAARMLVTRALSRITEIMNVHA